MLCEKSFYPLLAFLSAIAILSRALFYFRGAMGAMVVGDIIFMLLFAGLILMDKRALYFAVFTFLSSISLYYLATGQAIYDLTPLSLFFTVYVVRNFSVMKKQNASVPITVVLTTYLVLIIIALVGLLYSFNTQVGQEDTLKQFKYIIFLGQALYCGYLFSFIYDGGDNRTLKVALLTAIFCYFIASASGYLFPVFPNSDSGSREFLYKVMFRYPGLSTSNFTGHVLLLMAAIHMQMSRRGLFPLYAGFIIMLSVASQSRSVVLSGALLLILQFAGKHPKSNQMNTKEKKRPVKIYAALIMAFLALSLFTDHAKRLYGQLWDRVQGRISYENIPARLSLFHNAYRESKADVPVFLFGHGHISREKNPHNLFFSSLLLFGWPGTILMIAMSLIAFWHIPRYLFVLTAAQFEILFFTSIYDFLVIAFIAVCVCQRSYHEDWNCKPQLPA